MPINFGILSLLTVSILLSCKDSSSTESLPELSTRPFAISVSAKGGLINLINLEKCPEYSGSIYNDSGEIWAYIFPKSETICEIWFTEPLSKSDFDGRPIEYCSLTREGELGINRLDSAESEKIYGKDEKCSRENIPELPEGITITDQEPRARSIHNSLRSFAYPSYLVDLNICKENTKVVDNFVFFVYPASQTECRVWINEKSDDGTTNPLYYCGFDRVKWQLANFETRSLSLSKEQEYILQTSDLCLKNVEEFPELPESFSATDLNAADPSTLPASELNENSTSNYHPLILRSYSFYIDTEICSSENVELIFGPDSNSLWAFISSGESNCEVWFSDTDLKNGESPKEYCDLSKDTKLELNRPNSIEGKNKIIEIELCTRESIKAVPENIINSDKRSNEVRFFQKTSGLYVINLEKCENKSEEHESFKFFIQQKNDDICEVWIDGTSLGKDIMYCNLKRSGHADFYIDKLKEGLSENPFCTRNSLNIPEKPEAL